MCFPIPHIDPPRERKQSRLHAPLHPSLRISRGGWKRGAEFPNERSTRNDFSRKKETGPATNRAKSISETIVQINRAPIDKLYIFGVRGSSLGFWIERPRFESRRGLPAPILAVHGPDSLSSCRWQTVPQWSHLLAMLGECTGDSTPGGRSSHRGPLSQLW